MVRDFVVQQLRQLGYRTRLAGNGREALAALDDGSGIDLLLTDVILPGTLTGKQVADAAQRRQPDLKVLFMSGYTENAIVHHGRLDPGVPAAIEAFPRHGPRTDGSQGACRQPAQRRMRLLP